jgi:two-component system, OmpR family, alkaline phosphatase synthesis response regulator PhoP
MKVLIAEDDALIRQGLCEILEREGYRVIQAADGDEALDKASAEEPDFICLDVMMPGQSGFDVCRTLRQRGSDVPIVFITAKSEEIDKVLGLELGADDFIVKPFGIREVVARIRAISRRCLRGSSEPEVERFALADLDVAPRELRAFRGDTTLDLSLRDVAILQLLHRQAGKAVHRQTFWDECWGYDFVPNSRSLDQHISQLRKRIEIDPTEPAIIRTVHGVGYRYDPA